MRAFPHLDAAGRATRLLLAGALACTIAVAATVTGAVTDNLPEVGSLNGAQFRIDMPAQWSGGLVLYCHGYEKQPGHFSTNPAEPMVQAWLNEGYAVARSGYRTGGWNIRASVDDTEALRKYFEQKYGRAKERFVVGQSLGAFVAMTLLETAPTSYNGGLALCGPLASPQWFMARRVFDLLVLFDYAFPGNLPPLDHLSTAKGGLGIDQQHVIDLLQKDQKRASSLTSYAGATSVQELAYLITFFAEIAQDLQQRAGGNPFDNRAALYEGTGDDAAVNAGVKRYAGDPHAMAFLTANYTPTGRLTRPLLSVQNLHDPLIPLWVKNVYAALASQSGNDQLFAQQYVLARGHCVITPREIATAFDTLRRWHGQGPKPTGLVVDDGQTASRSTR